jgi:penicillin G amidase
MRRVPGVTAAVDIVRDRSGVPHIFAHEEGDALFGLGFAHGQDRLWQLELMRRAGSGRLAEVFGEVALSEDQLMRTVGLRRAADASWGSLALDTQRLLERYADGINAARADARLLPPEFLLLGVEPERWSGVDAIVCIKLVAWQLALQVGRELLRASLTERLAPDQIAQLLGGDAESLATRRALFGALEPGLRALEGALRGGQRAASSALGSNAWAVASERSTSGRPLLANDPHLELSMPALWYLAHLNAPGLNVIGATIPGVPGVIIGRNDRVAWGFTNNRADTQDLYVERLDPADPARYLTPGGNPPFEITDELIMIKDQTPQLLRVRSTRHGPVISDAVAAARRLMPEGYVLALRYAALLPGDHSVGFPLSVARARDVGDVLRSAETLLSPPQNILTADVNGGLALVAAGRVPVRSSSPAARGLLPMSGWLDEGEWQGFLPFAELPHGEHPANGLLVSANEDPRPRGYPHWLGADWAAPVRAERVRQQLEARPQQDVASFAALQLDQQSERARELCTRLLLASGGDADGDPALGDALRRLAAWDFVMRPDGPEPLIFAEWLNELERAVFQDELGERFADVAYEASEQLTSGLLDPSSSWCDDRRTPAIEGCSGLARAALQRSVANLSRRFGKDMGRWRWGSAHPVRFSHLVLGELPLIGGWFDTVLPSGGGNDTVNLAEYAGADADPPFTAAYGPSYRAIYDLADPEASSFIVGVGQSGNPLSPHYRDLAERWGRGERIAMYTSRERIDADSSGTLVLEPSTR